MYKTHVCIYIYILYGTIEELSVIILPILLFLEALITRKAAQAPMPQGNTLKAFASIKKALMNRFFFPLLVLL